MGESGKDSSEARRLNIELIKRDDSLFQPVMDFDFTGHFHEETPKQFRKFVGKPLNFVFANGDLVAHKSADFIVAAFHSNMGIRPLSVGESPEGDAFWGFVRDEEDTAILLFDFLEMDVCEGLGNLETRSPITEEEMSKDTLEQTLRIKLDPDYCLSLSNEEWFPFFADALERNHLNLKDLMDKRSFPDIVAFIESIWGKVAEGPRVSRVIFFCLEKKLGCLLAFAISHIKLPLRYLLNFDRKYTQQSYEAHFLERLREDELEGSEAEILEIGYEAWELKVSELSKSLGWVEEWVTEREEEIRSIFNLSNEYRSFHYDDGGSNGEEISLIIQQGESKTAEFKQTFALDVKTKQRAKYITDACIKTIAAFLNTEGGQLLVGVDDDGKFVGIADEVSKLYKTKDKFLLHFKDVLKTRIGEEFYPYIDQRVEIIRGKEIFVVSCSKADLPVFVDGTDFFVRTNPATDKLEGRKLLEYTKIRFPN